MVRPPWALGKRRRWLPKLAGYTAEHWKEQNCTVVAYPGENAPHHQSPFRHYDYIVRLDDGVRVYATEASLAAPWGRASSTTGTAPTTGGTE